MSDKSWQHALVLAFGHTAVLVLIFLWGGFDGMVQSHWDFQQKYLNQSQAESTIKQVVLDQESLQWAQQQFGWIWPWPESAYTSIVDFCQRAGSKAMAFDLTFPKHQSSLKDQVALSDRFRSSLPVIVPLALPEEAGPHPDWPDQKQADLLIKQEAGFVASGLVQESARFPAQPIYESVTLLADQRITRDPDGFVRHIKPFVVYEDRVLPSLGLALWLTGQTDKPEMIFRGDSFQIADRHYSMNSRGQTLIDLSPLISDYESWSFKDLFLSEQHLLEGGKSPAVEPSLFRDAYVLIGKNIGLIEDLKPNTININASSLDIHSAALQYFMSGKSFTPLSQKSHGLMMFCLSFMLALGAFKLPHQVGKLCFAATLLISPWVIMLGSASMGLIYPPWPVFLGLISTALWAVLWMKLTQTKPKLNPAQIFSNKVSPRVLAQLKDQDQDFEHRVESKELSLLHLEIVGFSEGEQSSDPKQVTRFLNQYMTDMIAVVHSFEGCLDRCEASSLRAFWNAPSDQDDHASLACQAALKCQEQFHKHLKLYQDLLPWVSTLNIGLHCGVGTVANRGAEQRPDYRVTGASVKRAVQLCRANQEFGTSIIASKQMIDQLKSRFCSQLIAWSSFESEAERVGLYEVMAEDQKPSQKDRELFSQALQACMNENWELAFRRLEQLPDRRLHRKYLKQCQGLISQPNRSWDGVWKLGATREAVI